MSLSLFPRFTPSCARFVRICAIFPGTPYHLTVEQGFSPHFDDVEVMVAQVEGSKVWQLHPERSDDDKLPLYSSGNFEQEEVGPPSQVINLEAGDFLYLPRGTIHQAKATDQPSMHITFSTYQQTTIGHFLSVALPRAIEVAMQDDSEFRHGLPLNYSDFLGNTLLAASAAAAAAHAA
jgi:lysine-specific demethylase/histidyl-hydroxylase NO66